MNCEFRLYEIMCMLLDMGKIIGLGCVAWQMEQLRKFMKGKI